MSRFPLPLLLATAFAALLLFVPPPAPEQPAAPLGTITGASTISAQQIDAVLASYGSPAQGTGDVWVSEGNTHGINAAYALAFFIHESSAGTASGWAGWKSAGESTHNVGNIICAGYATCWQGFRDYPTWQAGIADWYRLIDTEYVAKGLDTLDTLLPVYCPVADGCDPIGYARTVEAMVTGWENDMLTSYQDTNTVGGVFVPSGCPLTTCAISGYGFNAASHPGIDLAANLNDPVYAVLDGTVRVSQTWPCGNGIQVTQGEWQQLVCHLNGVAVADGATVRAGDLIGYAGASGEAYGVHTHFEIRQNGVSVDPNSFVRGE